jgi:hypothetical protein
MHTLRSGGVADLVYEPPSATRPRELHASFPRLLEEYGFLVEDVRAAALCASDALCISGRPNRGAQSRAV